LNTVLTLGGKLFHARAAVTQNEQWPIVRSRVRGMISSDGKNRFEWNTGIFDSVVMEYTGE